MKASVFFGSTCEESKQYREVLSPYDGRVASSVAVCSENDVLKVMDIAKKSAEFTKKVPLHVRVNWLLDVAKKLEINKEDMAKTMTDEVGKPIKFARVEVDRCIETIKLSANAMMNLHGETFDTTAMPSGKETLAFYKREAVGVVLAITPFNFPLNLVAHKIAPALVAGNAVVLKPTSAAPLTAYKFAKLFIESEFATKDALSVVYSGSGVNDALVQSPIPRVISFTGSVPVGREITSKAGIKKIALELGGNAATYIDKSADIKLAASKCALGAFINSGQVCISLQRIYVNEDVYEEFATALSQETKALHVGSPYEDETFIGPMINAGAVKQAKSWIKSAVEEGATVFCGSNCEDLMFEPTIMTDVTEDMNIVCEEVFAPIVSLIKVKDFDEAKVKMNNSPYGLQYSIFSNNMTTCKRAIDELNAGGIVINDIPTLRFDIQPYGGFKESGIGKEGPKYALEEEYTQIKSVVIC
ncbi:aldehyde dehydrogenase family protein [Sulfurospirillum arcachonense]|uniref:aldehyde dehydrogenase family protein n=1 Tax=Sulfurospirillum arcachonense TaxID=57666 RepID=UPI00046AC8F8|nr:aldehyde dehydrogenase family protein [Sulfurospirillum arcachonense]